MPFENIETYKDRHGKCHDIKKVFNSIQHRLNWCKYMENKGLKVIS